MGVRLAARIAQPEPGSGHPPRGIAALSSSVAQGARRDARALILVDGIRDTVGSEDRFATRVQRVVDFFVSLGFDKYNMYVAFVCWPSHGKLPSWRHGTSAGRCLVLTPEIVGTMVVWDGGHNPTRWILDSPCAEAVGREFENSPRWHEVRVRLVG